jgi:hypothetical protein
VNITIVLVTDIQPPIGTAAALEPTQAGLNIADSKRSKSSKSRRGGPDDDGGGGGGGDGVGTKAEQARKLELANIFASDAEQEVRIAKLEKRCATLSELVAVLLPHAKARFASEDAATGKQVEAQKMNEFAEMLEKEKAVEIKEKKAQRQAAAPKSWLHDKAMKPRKGAQKDSDVPTLPSISLKRGGGSSKGRSGSRK